MRTISSIFIIIFSLGSIHAQNTLFNIQTNGKWTTKTHEIGHQFNSKAQWIWLPDSLKADVMLARKSFEIIEIPEYTNLLITASSQYQLYVNGLFVNRGPARSAPHHQSYDNIDISPFLQVGNNVIAVRVHHQRNKFSYHLKGRAGLLVQLEFSEEAQIPLISSDPSWKIIEDPSWNHDAPVINRFQMVVADRIDLRSHLNSWFELGFKDGEWISASPLMRKVGWPSPQKDALPQVLTPPWTSLMPRDLPYLNQNVLLASDIVLAKEVSDWQKPIQLDGEVSSGIIGSVSAFANEDSFIKINNYSTSNYKVIIFDLGKVHNAIPILDIKGPRDTKIEMIMAPFLVDQSFSHNVVFSNFNDQLILSGSRNQWEATYFKPTRYLGIVIPPDTKDVRLYQIAIRQLEYPFTLKGSMSSDDASWIQDYMEASVRTINACTTDAYTDNYRERRQYAQTGYYAGLGNNWTYADPYLQRRYLIQIAQEQEANGMMPAYAPLGKDDFMIILDSNCLYIRSLQNYLLHSGDFATARKLLPAAQKLMDLLHSYTNEIGLIDNPPYAYWLDHALIDRRGANLTLNGHYLGALEDFAQVLSWLNEENTNYLQRAEKLRDGIKKNFWDETKGLFADAYVDDQKSDRFSEHGNAMALALKVASKDQARRIAQTILENDDHDLVLRKNGMTVVTPAMSYFLHKGLCAYGFIDESFEMFRERFDKMLDPAGNKTLYEEWWLDGTGRSGQLKPTSRSDAQTESAFPPALFAEYLLGVTATMPGLSKVSIRKTVSDLKHIKGKVPSPHGSLTIEWDMKNESERSLHLEIPEGMIVQLNTRSLNSTTADFLINRERTITKQEMPETIDIPSGNYEIVF